MKSKMTFFWIILTLLLGTLTACTPPATSTSVAPTEIASPVISPTVAEPPAIPSATLAEIPASLPVTATIPAPPTAGPETSPIIAPTIPPATASTGPTLAFLRDGDIWLVDRPGFEPYPLTIAGDILGFTWSPDGERLAAFNGRTLCFYHRDGSVRTACLDLGLNDEQAKIARRLALSPDQRFVVLWNPVNPQEDGAIGWMIVALDTSNIMYRIQDPKDWGAELDPDKAAGGFTGQPLFLADGRLLGSLSHKNLCSETGCHYQLFQFDFENRRFIPFDNKPEDGFSEGLSLTLSKDGAKLANYGIFFESCDSFVTFLDVFDVASASRKTYNLQGVATAGIGFSPSMDQAVVSRTSGCSNAELKTWPTSCKLAPGFDVQPMQSWKMEDEASSDLAPGIDPAISSDGSWLSFRSCLSKDASGNWQTSETSAAGLYLMNLSSSDIISVGDGVLPLWQP